MDRHSLMNRKHHNSTAGELHLPSLFNDPYLNPYRENFLERAEFIAMRRRQVLGMGNSSLEAVSDWHLRYGLHRQENGNWFFREWLPYAVSAQLLGEFNGWCGNPWFELHPEGNGDWSAEIPAALIHHGQSYQLHVQWKDGSGWRLPSAVRALRQEQTGFGATVFNAQVWEPESPYQWQNDHVPMPSVPVIYEAHTGIAQSEPKVGTFNEFRRNVLPRIAAGG
ncbi:MAG: hypothetical protein J6S21_02840, partial [Victivallales bacterium]|nr:hypothetical protein [Victivallales bacterium]